MPNGSKTTIVFKMMQENDQWVADDILYPDGKSLYSTRKALADERASLSKISKAERINSVCDKAVVLAVVSKTIQNGFGDDNGIDHFKKNWAIDKPNSKLWETLGTSANPQLAGLDKQWQWSMGDYQAA